MRAAIRPLHTRQVPPWLHGQGLRQSLRRPWQAPGQLPGMVAGFGLLSLALPLPGLQAQPVLLPPPPPLNPAWAFDPAAPSLSGKPPAVLLPGGGVPFNPNSPNQPLAIRSAAPPLTSPCPRIVPAQNFVLQPLQLPPSQVPRKNSVGCLSAADAVYGPDGCPRRLCGEKLGDRISLPPGGP